MMTTKTKAWVNLGLLLVTLGVNFLGAAGYINDSSQADVSARFQTLITPAGFTFSIWSIIYGLMIISLIVMIVKYEDDYYHQAIEAITPLLWITFAANMVWIVTFSYILVGIPTIFIVIYLLGLTSILMKLLSLNKERRWLLPLTFGMHGGWLFIATLVNISAFLVKIEWNGFGISETTWTIITMILSIVIVIYVLSQVKNATFTLPIAWAYFGIYKELQTAGSYGTLEVIALINMALLIAMAVYVFVRNKNSILPILDRQTREV